MLNRLLASLLFLLLSSPALLQAMEPLRVNFQPSPPEINGRLDDPAWQNLPWNTGCFLLGTDQAPTAGVKYKLYHDQDQLYLGVELEEPAMDKVRQTEYSPGSTMLWLNDSLEINVVTDPNLLSFYKIMVDVAGAWVDMKAVDDNTDTGKYLLDLDWASGAEIKVARAENAWLVEAAIPFGALAFSATTEPAWRINLGRNRYAVTPPELSATSPIPVRSHVVPAAFRTAVIADFNPTRFQLDLDEVNFSFDKNADGQYEAMVSTVVHNNTGSFAILHLEARLRDCASNASVQANKLLTLPRNEYQKHSLTLHPAGPGQYELDLELYANASRRRLLKKATRLVAAEYQPLAITLHRPCYRNNLYATMPDKTIEAEISLREGTGKPLAVTLVGPGGEAARQDFAAAQATQRVQFDGASLPDGDYVLKAACKLDGRTLQSEVRIRKLPYLPNEVWFDQEGITHVDGKPFLPFGWYGTQPNEQKPWYNSMLVLTPFGTLEEARQSHERQADRGQLLMAFPFQELPGTSWQPRVIFKDPETRKKGLTPEQRQKIIDYITGIRDVRGLLGYYMADEPECRDNNPIWYEEARDLISELDPYHPCIMLNWGPTGIKQYYRGCDVLLPDCYPQYFADGSTGHPRWCSSEWAKTSTALRPAWQMPLMTSWPAYSRDGKVKGVPPDYFDQRSQFFQAIIHNVKGFNMYAWHCAPWYTSLIFGPDAIGETLFRLKDYLLPNSKPDAVTVVTTPAQRHFQAGLKIRDGRVCLLAVNTSLETVTATFALQQEVGPRLFVAGENREIVLKGNTFVDTFAPRETHIYINNQEDANAVPAVAETVKTIEDFRRARRKDGNLIAVGEMKEADYLEYGAGKIPAGVPTLQASSDAHYYATKAFGSLYFLVDGIAEPLRVEMSWSPKTNDQAPWLDITLPEPAPVRKVVLYTPAGNLVAGKIVANKKSFPFQNDDSDVITVELDGDTVPTLRIEISNRKDKTPGDGKLNSRLLTEVEVY
ncbi:MAG: hypothetical protein GX574_16020 [Lentisphaerae bacterium]|nr:hypothetical protein [Lentisphaerota bacterium]